MIFERETRIRAPIKEVFAFFSDPKNLARITPPAMKFKIVNAPERPLREGDRIDYQIRIMGVPLRWKTLITEWDEGRAFADYQEKGPYRHWLHRHTFTEAGSEVVMHDRVDYELPFGVVGRLFGGAFVRRQIQSIFDYREGAIGSFLARK
ncbi:MAG TPA: SRPBCC family protein [Thermoanaerobaculia bacterium]|nr:SRPBCC family protein [Thermoanaerobaculia bacterium]